MTLLAWNCQGLGRALTVKNLRDMVKRYRPSIVFLMETKCSSVKGSRIRMKCGFSHELYVNLIRLVGGLAVWWHNSITLTVLYKSKNLINEHILSLLYLCLAFILR